MQNGSRRELCDFVDDAKRFLRHNRFIIEQAPMQLYSSALIFTPERSIVRVQFKKDVPTWIRKVPTVSKQWSPLLQVLEIDKGPSDAIAFSPDDKLLASASSKEIRLWDTETGALMQVLDNSPGNIEALAFISNAKLLSLHTCWEHVQKGQRHMYWGDIQKCMVWDLWTGVGTTFENSLMDQGDDMGRYRNKVRCISPDGKLLAVTQEPQLEGTIELWNTELDALESTLVDDSDDSEFFRRLLFSPDSRLIASILANHIIKIWDTMSGSTLHILQGPSESNYVSSVAMSGQLVALNSGAYLCVWDTMTGSSLWVKRLGPRGSLPGRDITVAISPDNKLVVCTTLGFDKCFQFQIWDVETGTMKQTIKRGERTPSSLALTFSHDGKLFVSRYSVGAVHLWSTARDDLIDPSDDRSYAGPESIIHHIVALNGRQIASSGDRGTIDVWDPSKGSVARTFEGLFDFSKPRSFASVSFSPNGDLLAADTEAAGGSIRVLDISRGTTLLTLGRNLTYASRVAFSPDGKLVAIAAFDTNQPVSKVKVWKNIWNWLAADFDEPILSSFHGATAVSPNVDLVALASDDNAIRLWDISRASRVRKLEGHCSSVGALTFSPDGKLIASAPRREAGGRIIVWDAATGTIIQSFPDHSRRIYTLEFSPDCRTLASASQDKTVRLWNTTNGVALQVLDHLHPVTTLVFSPDGTVLASSDPNFPVTFWNVASGTILRILHEPGVVYDFSTQGKLVASSFNHTLNIWSTATGAISRILEGHSQIISAVMFSPNGQLVASTSKDVGIRLWDIATGTNLRLRGHSNDVKFTAIDFSPNGTLLAAASDDGLIRLWDSDQGVVKHDLGRGLDKRPFHTISFSRDGKVIAAVSKSWRLYLWEAETGAVFFMHRYCTHVSLDEKAHVRLSPNGDRVALSLSSFGHRTSLWDMTTGTILQFLDKVIEDPCELLSSLAISPDPFKQVVASSYGRKIEVWNGLRSDRVHTLVGHSSTIHSISFSPDGKVIASLSSGSSIRLWDTENGTAMHVLKGHSREVNVVAFSQDSKLLASAALGDTIKLWNSARGMILRSFDLDTGILDTRIIHIAFSQRGPYLETNQGLLTLEDDDSTSEIQRKRPSNIFVRRNWVLWDMENLLWLPIGYRVVHASCESNSIAFIDLPGGLTFIEFGPRETGNSAGDCEEVS